MDAAHFNNFGIPKPYRQAISNLEDFASEEMKKVIFSTLRELDIFSGDTFLLPQKINLGPDRIVDNTHIELAKGKLSYFSSMNYIISISDVNTYIIKMRRVIINYINEQKKSNNHALASCAQCYLDAYRDDRFAHKIYITIYEDYLQVYRQFIGASGNLHSSTLMGSRKRALVHGSLKV